MHSTLYVLCTYAQPSCLVLSHNSQIYCIYGTPCISTVCNYCNYIDVREGGESTTLQGV